MNQPNPINQNLNPALQNNLNYTELTQNLTQNNNQGTNIGGNINYPSFTPQPSQPAQNSAQDASTLQKLGSYSQIYLTQDYTECGCQYEDGCISPHKFKVFGVNSNQNRPSDYFMRLIADPTPCLQDCCSGSMKAYNYSIYSIPENNSYEQDAVRRLDEQLGAPFARFEREFVCNCCYTKPPEMVVKMANNAGQERLIGYVKDLTFFCKFEYGIFDQTDQLRFKIRAKVCCNTETCCDPQKCQTTQFVVLDPVTEARVALFERRPTLNWFQETSCFSLPIGVEFGVDERLMFLGLMVFVNYMLFEGSNNNHNQH